MTDQKKPSREKPVVATERHSEFVATAEAEGDITRQHVVGAVTETKTFADPDPDQDMPLPTDLKTVFLGGLFGLAVLTALHLAAEIALPVVLAIVLKLLLQPFVRMLERIHIPRALGALLAVLLVIVIFGGVVSLLAGPATAWASKLPEAFPKIRDSIGAWRGPIVSLQDTLQRVQHYLGGTEGGATASLKPSSVATALLGGTASALSGFFTMLLILFYMLVSGEVFLRRMVEILPRFKDKRNAVELSFHIERDVSAYLVTVTCINLVVGVATGCEMWLCGVNAPVLWGALAFILNFIPFLGPAIGIVVFLLASVLSLGVTFAALLPAGLYLGIHILEGEMFTPMLLARRFTINPVAVILALIFWFWMWGVAGAILAVPMLAVTKIICDDLRPLRALGHLLEG